MKKIRSAIMKKLKLSLSVKGSATINAIQMTTSFDPLKLDLDLKYLSTSNSIKNEYQISSAWHIYKVTSNTSELANYLRVPRKFIVAKPSNLIRVS